MRNDLEEKKIHGSLLFPFQYYAKQQDNAAIFIPCHWHEEIEVLVIEKGSFTVIIDGNAFTGSAGDVFFFHSCQLHQIQGHPGKNAFYSFVFSLHALYFREQDYVQTTLLEPLGEKWCFPKLVAPGNPCYRGLIAILEELRRLEKERPVAFQLLVKAELYRMIALFKQHQAFVLKEKPSQEHSYTALRLKQVLQYIADHYMEPLSLEQAAGIMHMSAKYFSSYFSDALHISFVQYINRYRIEQACILLQTTALSIMEVGQQVGYCNFSYFIRRFKEFQGCTPIQYRRKTGG